MSPLQPANSSMFQAHGYDPASRTLALHFHGNADVHHFKDVAPELAEQFAKAESKGRFFNANIRGQYAHEKVPAGITNGAEQESADHA